jgi:four helix bundle protein
MNAESKSELPFAKAFWDLIVYQKARALQGSIFKFSRTLPVVERYSLTDQVRRSARSIGAQLAEAWAKRDYEKHFISKLSDAESENLETQHWIITAVDDGYLPRDQAKILFDLSLEIGRMLTRMSDRADDFCPNPNRLREESLSSEWFDPLPHPFAAGEEVLSSQCSVESGPSVKTNESSLSTEH